MPNLARADPSLTGGNLVLKFGKQAKNIGTTKESFSWSFQDWQLLKGETAMKKVYGLMVQAGDANEMLWDRGVWETEEAAKEYLQSEMRNINGIWVTELKVNDSIPLAAEPEAEEMVLCDLCGIKYNPADVNVTDFEDAVCINCEPEYLTQENIL